MESAHPHCRTLSAPREFLRPDTRASMMWNVRSPYLCSSVDVRIFSCAFEREYLVIFHERVIELRANELMSLLSKVNDESDSCSNTTTYPQDILLPQHYTDDYIRTILRGNSQQETGAQLRWQLMFPQNTQIESHSDEAECPSNALHRTHQS